MIQKTNAWEALSVCVCVRYVFPVSGQKKEAYVNVCVCFYYMLSDYIICIINSDYRKTCVVYSD